MKPEIRRKGSVYKRCDGYWFGTVYYLDEYRQLKRKAFGGKTKKLVLEKIHNYISVFKKTHEDNNWETQLLKDAFQEYLIGTKYYLVSRTTYDGNESLMNAQVIPRLGMRKVGDISSSDIQKTLFEMMTEGYSFATVKKYYNLLGEFFRWAVSGNRINLNPMQSVKLTRKQNYMSAQGKEETAKCDEITILTQEEIAIIREEAFAETNAGVRKYPHAAAYFLMLNTGLRMGEMLGLRHSDIDLENRMLCVNRSVKNVRKREDTSDEQND